MGSKARQAIVSSRNDGANRRVDEEFDAELAAHLESRHSPDWEDLIAQGTVPALALGAERRLRRGQS